MKELEYRFSELGIEGKTLVGTVMRYGEISSGAPRPERFLPGAFSPIGDVILNKQHERVIPLARTGGGGLELTDTPERLEMRADVIDTRDAADTLHLVEKRVLRGLSVEFRAVSEHYEAGIRVIEKAILSGIGVVDTPAYRGSKVEARAIGGVTLAFSIPYGVDRDCGCCPDADVVHCETGCYSEAAAGTDEVLLVAGDYKGSLASKNRGTLRLRETEDGLVAEAQIADTQAGRDIIAQAQDVPVYARPILDFANSDYTVVDGVARLRRGRVRGITLGATDKAEGWQPIRIIRAEENRSRWFFL